MSDNNVDVDMDSSIALPTKPKAATFESSLSSNDSSALGSSKATSFSDLAEQIESLHDVASLNLSQKILMQVTFRALQRNITLPTAPIKPKPQARPLPGQYPTYILGPGEDVVSIPFDVNKSNAPSALDTAELATLLELLSSSLKDVSSQEWLSSSGHADQYVLADPLSCEPDSGCLSPTSNEVQSDAKKADLINPRTVQNLLMDNLDHLISLLKPSLPSDCLVGSPVVYEPLDLSSDLAEEATKPSRVPNLISQLPSETLQRILRLARDAQEALGCDCGASTCPMSRQSIQRWSLTLSLTCKSWRTSAQAAAYSTVRIRNRAQMFAFAQILNGNASLANSVLALDIKVPALTPLNGVAQSNHAFLGGRHRSRVNAFPWLTNQQPTTPATPAPFGRMSAVSQVGDQIAVAELIEKCPALAKVELNISRSTTYSYATGGFAFASDFLERGLPEALSHRACLRSLALRQCVDFGEIETILLQVDTLQILRCEGGIDNLDGRDDVLEDVLHKCRLQSVYINNCESSDIGENQLCWILEPSVGSLRSLEVATSILLNQGMGAQAAWPPFAGALFANLLVDLAPTLTRLALKDSLHQGIGGLPGAVQTNPSLRATPHNGSFDFALSHCRKITELCIDWMLTGDHFLNSLKRMPVDNLVLLGSSPATSGTDFNNYVQSNVGLKKLTLTCTAVHGPLAVVWLARDIRKLRKICDEYAAK